MTNYSRSKQWRQAENLFALIIGIDKYEHAIKLTGAVADANNVDGYLRDHLKLSDRRIINLRDKGATRKSIVNAFHGLCENGSIAYDDPILIYFAGHGCEIPRPRGWDTGGQEKIQGIFPQDVQPTVSSTRTVFPIPDRSIASWINMLSAEKGNNITVILDCCHSSSGTRGESVRSDEFEGEIPPDIDDLMTTTRGQIVTSGFINQHSRSHVLLAACGATELAREVDGRGLFTRALLDILLQPGADKLSYAELTKQLPRFERQTPQCEGHHKGRMLFSVQIPAMGFHFFEVVQNVDKTFRLEAGKAHGVTPDSLFHVYNEAAVESGSNKRLCTLRVHHVSAFHAVAYLDSRSAVTLSGPTFAHQVRSGTGKGLQVHFSRELLDLVPLHDLIADNVVAAEARNAGFKVHCERMKAVFTVAHRVVTRHGYHQLPYSVPVDTNSISRVLLSASRWKLHLDNCSTDQWGGGVHLDFFRLTQSLDKVDERGFTLLERRGARNLNVKNLVDIVVKRDDFYGIEIRNETKINLYPALFYFDASDLSITSHYKGPVGGGGAVPDPPLPARSNGSAGLSLTIGYGAGGGLPLNYELPNGLDLDVGILKLYLTTRPIDFEWLEQLSPFGGRRGLASPSDIQQRLTADSWGTISCTIVQRRYASL